MSHRRRIPNPTDYDPTYERFLQLWCFLCQQSAHQVVMQAVMTLYAKEVATPEFVYAAVKRLLPPGFSVDPPQDFENALLFWINQVTSALKTRSDQEDNVSAYMPFESLEVIEYLPIWYNFNVSYKFWLWFYYTQGGQKCPDFPKANSLQDLCDGSSLAALVSFYCPEELHWSSIIVSQLPNVSDCVRNLTLVSEFCSKALPANIFHMAPEDIYYMRGWVICWWRQCSPNINSNINSVSVETFLVKFWLGKVFYEEGAKFQFCPHNITFFCKSCLIQVLCKHIRYYSDWFAWWFLNVLTLQQQYVQLMFPFSIFQVDET